MAVLLPKMAMVSDCDGAGIAAVCKERKRRLRHVRLHYIQCFQVINVHYSSAANSNSYFLFLFPSSPSPAWHVHNIRQSFEQNRSPQCLQEYSDIGFVHISLVQICTNDCSSSESTSDQASRNGHFPLHTLEQNLASHRQDIEPAGFEHVRSAQIRRCDLGGGSVAICSASSSSSCSYSFGRVTFYCTNSELVSGGELAEEKEVALVAA